MTIGGVAPGFQGRTLLPVLGKVTATRYVDRVYVRLVSGQSAADFADRAENLAHGFRALLCRVRTAKSGAIRQRCEPYPCNALMPRSVYRPLRHMSDSPAAQLGQGTGSGRRTMPTTRSPGANPDPSGACCTRP